MDCHNSLENDGQPNPGRPSVPSPLGPGGVPSPLGHGDRVAQPIAKLRRPSFPHSPQTRYKRFLLPSPVSPGSPRSPIDYLADRSVQSGSSWSSAAFPPTPPSTAKRRGMDATSTGSFAKRAPGHIKIPQLGPSPLERLVYLGPLSPSPPIGSVPSAQLLELAPNPQPDAHKPIASPFVNLDAGKAHAGDRRLSALARVFDDMSVDDEGACDGQPREQA